MRFVVADILSFVLVLTFAVFFCTSEACLAIDPSARRDEFDVGFK